MENYADLEVRNRIEKQHLEDFVYPWIDEIISKTNSERWQIDSYSSIVLETYTNPTNSIGPKVFKIMIEKAHSNMLLYVFRNDLNTEIFEIKIDANEKPDLFNKIYNLYDDVIVRERVKILSEISSIQNQI